MRRLAAMAAAAVLAAAVAPPASASAPADPANDRRVIAVTAQGREVVARHYGALDAPVQVVVIGQMHGSEPGGRAVVQELAGRRVPAGVGLWLVVSMNPDGDARGTRANARGVDLNRNFPSGWRPGSHGTYYPGRAAASEAETRGMIGFLRDVRPTAVLSYHQAFDVVDISHPRSEAAGRQLARYMGERASRVGCDGPCLGTMTQWIDRSLRTVAITVELDGRVSRREADRAAAAVLRLGSWLGG
ncbi:MAG: M14 family zinc carboxypeptidase [Candidatus Nanopelagicales bacterium]